MEDSVVDSYGVAARNCEEQEETSTLVTHATDTKSTEWTDEKHSSYLNSMEATFVNQLYKSSDLFGRHSHRNSPSKHKQTSHCASSSQFKVHRDGCWTKIDFKRDEAQVNQEDGVLLTNPWIQHYRCSERQPIRKFSASRAKAPLATSVINQYPAHNFQLWRQDSVGSITEVTAQNFNDEDLEEEKSGRIHETKRTRTSTDHIISCNDQVVPFENIVQADDAAEDHEHPGG